MDKLSVLTSPEFLSNVTQIITALTALFAAAASLIAMVRTKQNGIKIEQVHLATNSMKDELVHEVRVASIALGEKRAEERQKNGLP